MFNQSRQSIKGAFPCLYLLISGRCCCKSLIHKHELSLCADGKNNFPERNAISVVYFNQLLDVCTPKSLFWHFQPIYHLIPSKKQKIDKAIRDRARKCVFCDWESTLQCLLTPNSLNSY